MNDLSTGAHRLDGYNSDIQNEQVQKLAELFPEAVREGKVDFDALKTTLGKDIALGEQYGLNWTGKAEAKAKAFEKTVSTLHPQPEESVDWDITQNMFIEGDNLEALKVLHKAYYGKIKMIYIDPPYNTGNDFVYNDDFKKTRREQALEEGAIDDEGNVTRDDGLRVNTGGHKHSNWLDMMYPRLFLARNLLRQDGVIFVSIDDNEVHNLRLMMNDIFGEENFVAQITIINNPKGRVLDKYFSTTHEYVLAFSRSPKEKGGFNIDKNQEEIDKNFTQHDEAGQYRSLELRNTHREFGRFNRPKLFYPIFVNSANGSVSLEKNTEHTLEVLPLWDDGFEGCWTWGVEKLSNETSKVFAKEVNGVWKIYRKSYAHEVKTQLKTVWDDSAIRTESGQATFNNLFESKSKIFQAPKSVELIKRMLRTSTNDNDIVLDFFGGSGTLAHTTSELNAEDSSARRWITVQLSELTDEKSEAYKAGYKTIANISRERIRRAGAKISKDFVGKIAERETSLDLGFRSYALGDSNFKKWNELVAEPDEIKQQAFDNLNPLENGVTDDDLLTEILLKRGVSPLAKIKIHDNFVFVPSENLAISLSRHMTEELFAQILAKSPSQIILLDQAFRDDVNLKRNLILQAEKKNTSIEVL